MRCEFAFLQGARKTIQHCSPVMLMEINPQALQASGTSAEDFKSLLADPGYTLYAESESPAERHEVGKISMEKYHDVIFNMRPK